MAKSKTQGPNKWLQLAALRTVPLIMVLGNSMLIPVLPDMGRQMGLDKSATGLAVTAFSLLPASARWRPVTWATSTAARW
jgi:ACDE family multidrug resistance protein